MSCRPRPAEAPGRAGSRGPEGEGAARAPLTAATPPAAGGPREVATAGQRVPQPAARRHRAALATAREQTGGLPGARGQPRSTDPAAPPERLREATLAAGTPLRNTARTHTCGRPNARRAHVRNYRWRRVCDCHVCTALSLVQDVFMSRPVTAYLSVSSSVHRTQSSCRRRGEDGPPGPRGAAWRSARLRAREAPGEGSSWASLNHVPALWAGAGLQETPGPVRGAGDHWGR